MNDPQEPGEQPDGIESAIDMPEQPGMCAFLGAYVPDGQTVIWLGEEYICQAPNLVRTG